jgi:dipeptidyl aminopeptidase/acylaminoacyl peptidase
MTQHPEFLGKDERNFWPSFRRPDLKPPQGWNHSLLTGISRPRSHSVSPSGDTIAFFWDKADLSDLYTMPTKGGWPVRLTFERDPLPYWFDDPPQWSPDGQWLAYTYAGHVWVISAQGGTPKNITSQTAGGGTPRWMPDSYHVLITYEREVYSRILLTDRDGGWPKPISPLKGRDFNPQAAPDSRQIVYLHRPLEDLERTDIMLADVETGEILSLTDIPKKANHTPRWSPDGKQLAFTSERTGFYEIYLLDFSSGQERQLTHAGHDLDDLSWSPDGLSLLCTVNRGGAFDLGLVHVTDGKFEDLHTAWGFHARPQWLPDGHTITFEFEDPLHPPDIFRMEMQTRAVTQLTFSMPPIFKTLNLVKPEAIRYASLDGLEIPAFIYHPHQSNGAAIVHPHGGPTAQYTLEWDIWAQYMAAKGYTILAPNFRGSTGYGSSFERANFGVWGVEDTRDCLAAADWLANLTAIDPERIGILGASYGGYLTICSLAFDPKNRFACGVTKYGDCNLLTSWADCDNSGREDLYKMMGHPSENRAGYKAGSPVWQVSDIQAPLLILHGLSDPYVPPSQSEELVEALRREGKIFEYKTYPDEGHGFMKRKNQLDFYERMERFLDWYLL